MELCTPSQKRQLLYNHHNRLYGAKKDHGCNGSDGETVEMVPSSPYYKVKLESAGIGLTNQGGPSVAAAAMLAGMAGW